MDEHTEHQILIEKLRRMTADQLYRLVMEVCGAYLNKPKWISVDEKLPSPWKDVLVFDIACDDCFVGYRDDEKNWVIPGFPNDEVSISHWMPLPELPRRSINE